MTRQDQWDRLVEEAKAVLQPVFDGIAELLDCMPLRCVFREGHLVRRDAWGVVESWGWEVGVKLSHPHAQRGQRVCMWG